MKNAESILNAKEITPTAMRLLVLEYLQGQSTAISLNDLRKGFGPADQVTLYRTLKTFQEKGLIHSIEDGTGSTKYALCKERCNTGQHEDVHVHFYCNRCQETTCLPNSLIPEIDLPALFKSEEISLLVKGSCAKCHRAAN